MANVITYGTFDFFHEGHRNILRRAKEIAGKDGRLFVGVTSENYDRERGKLNVCQDLQTRMRQVQDSGFADEVFVEEYEGQKIEDLRRYSIDKFVIGDDWAGKYDYLGEWCEVVYLPRTKGVSSTGIRNDSARLLHGGIVGSGRIAGRFVAESRFVSGVVFDAVFNPRKSSADSFAANHGLKGAFDDFDKMLGEVDLVYVATPHVHHAEYVRRALMAGKHVLCEKPMTLSAQDAKELYALAEKHDVVLQEALKTAFAPGFKHLVNLAKGGLIGQIRQVRAIFTKLMTDKTLREFNKAQGGGAVSELLSYVLCPTIKLLGRQIDPRKIDFNLIKDEECEVETFASGMIKYDGATALLTVGLTAKDEGCLSIAGTKGYIWVPSPWWKTEYFEIRNDMGQPTRRFFFQFAGDGLRYELAEFVKRISMGIDNKTWSSEDSIESLGIIEFIRNGQSRASVV